jgi:hypothetical protein
MLLQVVTLSISVSSNDHSFANGGTVISVSKPTDRVTKWTAIIALHQRRVRYYLSKPFSSSVSQ